MGDHRYLEDNGRQAGKSASNFNSWLTTSESWATDRLSRRDKGLQCGRRRAHCRGRGRGSKDRDQPIRVTKFELAVKTI